MEENKTVHTKCFAYNDSENEKEQCCALTERICNKGECPFHKKWDECDNDTKRLIVEQKQAFLKNSGKVLDK